MCVCVCVCTHFKIGSYFLGLLWLFGFYGISTMVGYLTPNSFF